MKNSRLVMWSMVLHYRKTCLGSKEEVVSFQIPNKVCCSLFGPLVTQEVRGHFHNSGTNSVRRKRQKKDLRAIDVKNSLWISSRPIAQPFRLDFKVSVKLSIDEVRRDNLDFGVDI